VRVVTNGYWAKTYAAAFKRLSSLNNAGLTEINFSTGDDHLAFVPESSIKNGVKAALELKMTTVINIESNKMKEFNSFGFLQDDDLKPFLAPGEDGNTLLRIVNGVWIPFTNKTKSELVEVADSKPEKIINSIKRCTNLFTSIIIDSSHNMIACCGLTCKYSKYLYLGNVSKKSIKELYENQFNDFLKIWLFTEGPHKIMDYLTSNNSWLSYDLNNKDHMCLVCATILNNDQYLSKIKSDLTNISSNILLKYFLTLKSNHHEKT
jgi:hypothetical protein